MWDRGAELFYRTPLLFVPLIQPLSNSDWVGTLSELYGFAAEGVKAPTKEIGYPGLVNIRVSELPASSD
jgi:hypothetical protein